MTTVFEWAGRHGIQTNALAELLDILDPTRRSVAVPSDASSESAVQSKLRIKAASLHCALWRNNNGARKDDTGRLIRYGLGHDSGRINAVFKSSDLIGILPRLVETQHVGQVWGIFTAVECKAPGWKNPNSEREIAQANFISTVNAMGGRAQFAQSVEDVFP